MPQAAPMPMPAVTVAGATGPPSVPAKPPSTVPALIAVFILKYPGDSVGPRCGQDNHDSITWGPEVGRLYRVLGSVSHAERAYRELNVQIRGRETT